MPIGKPRTMGRGWDYTETPVPGNVLAALEELGVEVLREVAGEIVAMCPMHLARTGKQDRHPSWTVNAESGIHNCFSCGYKGPFVKLAEDMLDVDRGEAVRWVKARGGIERARKILERIIEPAPTIDTSKQINEASLALLDHPPIKEIKRRRLTHEAVQHHGVLWDSRPTKRCWVLPIRDPDTGTLWGWQEKNDRFFRNRPRDVRKSKTLFGLDVFKGDVAILVESPLDVVRLTSAGISGGLAAFGATISDHQINILKAVADRVISALDNPLLDPAGARSSETLRVNRPRMGIPLQFLNYDGTDAKDIGDMTDEQIRTAIDTAHSSAIVRFPHAHRASPSVPRRSRRQVS